MKVKEFRVVMPLSLAEYQIGQLYSTAEASKNQTGGGEGIEIVKNEAFENSSFLGSPHANGQYTYKIFHLQSKVPSYIRQLAPKGSLEIHEESWNAYPYCKTVVSNPDYMKDNFNIQIETLHASDRGEQENALQLSADILGEREIIYIDIANDEVETKDYKDSEDPSQFNSPLTNRGPLIGNWKETCDPVMCAYKVVTAEFKWMGIQNKVETYIQKVEQKLILNFNRQVFCWMDIWYNLTMNDIRTLEKSTKDILDDQRANGPFIGGISSSSEVE